MEDSYDNLGSMHWNSDWMEPSLRSICEACILYCISLFIILIEAFRQTRAHFRLSPLPQYVWIFWLFFLRGTNENIPRQNEFRYKRTHVTCNSLHFSVSDKIGHN
jgi:hypothetical protein